VSDYGGTATGRAASKQRSAGKQAGFAVAPAHEARGGEVLTKQKLPG
jgi:hypothetical protein